MTEPIVVTERITIATTSAEDQDEFLSSVEASQSLLHPWIDAIDTPARFAEMLSRAEGAEFHPFVVRERVGGRLAGAVNISQVIRGPFQSAFTGYWAFAGGAGRGLMTDGLRAVVRYAFSDLELHRLEANIQPTNLASIRLAERCGFRYEGFSPNYLKVFGEWRDHNRYAITAEMTKLEEPVP